MSGPQRDLSFPTVPDAERIKRALGSMLGVQLAPPAPPAPDHAFDSRLQELRLALAVRGATNPRTLIPASLPTSAQLAYFDRLATDCENVSTDDSPAWMLKDNVRRAVLQSHDPRTIAHTIASVPASEVDAITEALRAVYLVPPADLSTLSALSLRALATVGEWSSGHAPFTVDITEVRRHAARASRAEQYQRILANGFVGRAGELDEAYQFFAGPLGHGLKHAWIWGAGGVGKSTLVAAVALRILEATPEAALVHLDFDRTDLDPTRSVNLDLEVLRQAGGASAVSAKKAADVRERIRGELGSALALGHDTARQSENLESAFSGSKSTLVDALDWLSDARKPLLLILDTCEQVQSGGAEYWNSLQGWLQDLTYATGAPEVRVLFSGRADPTAWPVIGGTPVFCRRLDDLTLDNSVAVLRHRGVSEASARTAAAVFGGNPLVLQLVADFARDRGEDAIDGTPDAQVPESLVQGVLYGRFLKHIEDEDARRYAHPGLVLPELSADLIEHVLAPARRDAAMTSHRAHAIFKALQGATWLTEFSRSKATLALRPDVRRLLMRLIRSDWAQQEVVTRIHESAIAYHSKQSTDASRALVLYHRLMLVDEPEQLAQFDAAEVKSLHPFLRPHLDDFRSVVQTYLAEVGVGDVIGPDDALRALSDKDWATYLIGKGSEPGYGDRVVRESDPMIAMKLWRRRSVGDLRRPPTFVLEALTATGDWSEADDIEFDSILDELTTMNSRGGAARRLVGLTKLALVRRPSSLSSRHEQELRRRVSDTPESNGYYELAAIAGIAEAFSDSDEPIISMYDRSKRLQSETRLMLVHLRRRGGDVHWTPHLDALTIIQSDWSERAASLLPQTAVAEAREALAGLQGAPLDQVNRTLARLRKPVPISLSDQTPADLRIALLRGPTPEMIRPARQALREAFTSEEQIRTLIANARKHFSICPRDFEPDLFAKRAMRDPANTFLTLTRFSDSARVLGNLLETALLQVPYVPKLQRVHRTWRLWDEALCGVGMSSNWKHESGREDLR